MIRRMRTMVCCSNIRRAGEDADGEVIIVDISCHTPRPKMEGESDYRERVLLLLDITSKLLDKTLLLTCRLEGKDRGQVGGKDGVLNRWQCLRTWWRGITLSSCLFLVSPSLSSLFSFSLFLFSFFSSSLSLSLLFSLSFLLSLSRPLIKSPSRSYSSLVPTSILHKNRVVERRAGRWMHGLRAELRGGGGTN